MISIIVCSRSKSSFEHVSQSICNSVGTTYEIVEVDNSGGKYGICEAYNIGAAQAKYDTLCFMHEDVAFVTKDWGRIVLQAFDSNPRLGLLGLAGSSYKPAVPSGWSFDASRNDTTHMNIIQHQTGTSIKNTVYNNPRNESISKVASVDGVWFCTTKSIAQQIRFDDKTFRAFHCYDVDFSLSVLQHYEVAVTFDILIEHFSEGSFNDSWVTETFKLHQKWRHVLPINLDQLSAQEIANEEFKAFHHLLPRLIGKPTLCLTMAQLLWRNNIAALVGAKRFTMMNLLLLKKAF